MRSRYVYDHGEVVYAEEKGEVTVNRLPETQDAGFHVMPDVQPFISMIDGSVINSRSRYREHLRDHGCIEVGNDSSLRAKPKPLQSPPGLKEAIIKAVNEVEQRQRR